MHLLTTVQLTTLEQDHFWTNIYDTNKGKTLPMPPRDIQQFMLLHMARIPTSMLQIEPSRYPLLHTTFSIISDTHNTHWKNRTPTRKSGPPPMASNPN
jgi:hypothetical protein